MMRLLYSSLDTSLENQAGPESGQRHLLAKLVDYTLKTFIILKFGLRYVDYCGKLSLRPMSPRPPRRLWATPWGTSLSVASGNSLNYTTLLLYQIDHDNENHIKIKIMMNSNLPWQSLTIFPSLSHGIYMYLLFHECFRSSQSSHPIFSILSKIFQAVCHHAAGQGLPFFRQCLRQSREVSRAELSAGGADHGQQRVGDLGREPGRPVPPFEWA